MVEPNPKLAKQTMDSHKIYISREDEPTEIGHKGIFKILADRNPQQRPQVRGKFIYLGEKKLWIRGVTYGTFRPDKAGNQFNNPSVVERDFAQMAGCGINAVRTYTPPPRWLLDIAWRQGLFVMCGLPWEQHVAFMDGGTAAASIEDRVRAMIREVSGHPALLCYAIGNEIPSSIVRWHGRKKIEHFIKRLYSTAKKEDPEALVTYVNYPTTEYLQLPFLDFYCFNVYLEDQDRLKGYLQRLQNIAGDRPLVMGEIGLDSRRNGEKKQAEILDWQIRTAFRSGCAGIFVFAWTDEWYRGGYEIDDWDFGLTDRNRQPKQALHVVRKAFSEVPFPADFPWPKISVVVCSYNGEKTIAGCCRDIKNLDYPNFEVIIVDDGSTDKTPTVIGGNGFRVIKTPNNGLSAARNIGWQAATGDIVAYTDDDARPDPDWLKYLAITFLDSDCAGVGGPNIAPPGDGQIADGVANAPGGPLHVLITDREAEHIPGCNMAFRRERLKAVGGFDPRFRVAGDDVDLCWRIQQSGGWLAFNPSAMVWHHRRNSIRSFWRQQKGYGKAEAHLEQKWPEKYNAIGHLTWNGRLYGKGFTKNLCWRKWRVYHGTWGAAPFQSLYDPKAGVLESLPLMPEWYILNMALALLCVLGFLWKPLFVFLPLLLLTAGLPLLSIVKSVSGASFTTKDLSRFGRLKLQLITALLHMIQPVARLYGRLRYGLTPWRRRGTGSYRFPWPRTSTIWSERWQAQDMWLKSIQEALRIQGAIVRCGGDWDRWDLEVRGGLLGVVRMRMAVEEHGGGKQLLRLRSWPRVSLVSLTLMPLFAGLWILANIDQAWIASAMLGLVTLPLALGSFKDCAAATATCLQALRKVKRDRPELYHARIDMRDFSMREASVASGRNGSEVPCSLKLRVLRGLGPSDLDLEADGR
jgi:GT2 family glycosyltransferase